MSTTSIADATRYSRRPGDNEDQAADVTRDDRNRTEKQCRRVQVFCVAGRGQTNQGGGGRRRTQCWTSCRTPITPRPTEKKKSPNRILNATQSAWRHNPRKKGVSIGASNGGVERHGHYQAQAEIRHQIHKLLNSLRI